MVFLYFLEFINPYFPQIGIGINIKCRPLGHLQREFIFSFSIISWYGSERYYMVTWGINSSSIRDNDGKNYYLF